MLNNNEHLPVDPSLSGSDNLVKLIEHNHPEIIGIIDFDDYLFEDVSSVTLEDSEVNTSVKMVSKPSALITGTKVFYYSRFDLSLLNNKVLGYDESTVDITDTIQVIDLLINVVPMSKEELDVTRIDETNFRFTARPDAYTVFGSGIISLEDNDGRPYLRDLLSTNELHGLNYKVNLADVIRVTALNGLNI